MEITQTPEGVKLGGNARQRFHDARGYGTPLGDGSVLVTPVEAAHLLFREDIPAIDGADFPTYLSQVPDPTIGTKFSVYKDFRDRGFYLRPVGDDRPVIDFMVFERGTKPSDGQVAYEISVVDERSPVPGDTFTPRVLAIVDEEGEIGYVEIAHWTPEGDVNPPAIDAVRGVLIGDRVLIPQPPTDLYGEYFFGQPVSGREAIDDTLQLSLVEAAYLQEIGILTVDGGSLVERARSIEGSVFAPRLAVYSELRNAGIVTKTGYKFGADFRLYPSFTSVTDMSHSTALVRIRSPADSIHPHEISLDVRLAHGVGKRMLFALRKGPADNPTDWISIQRITP